jgi:hypothetical protein
VEHAELDISPAELVDGVEESRQVVLHGQRHLFGLSVRQVATTPQFGQSQRQGGFQSRPPGFGLVARKEPTIDLVVDIEHVVFSVCRNHGAVDIYDTVGIYAFDQHDAVDVGRNHDTVRVDHHRWGPRHGLAWRALGNHDVVGSPGPAGAGEQDAQQAAGQCQSHDLFRAAHAKTVEGN